MVEEMNCGCCCCCFFFSNQPSVLLCLEWPIRLCKCKYKYSNKINVENNDCVVGFFKWNIDGSTSSRSAKYIHTQRHTPPVNKVIQCIIKNCGARIAFWVVARMQTTSWECVQSSTNRRTNCAINGVMVNSNSLHLYTLIHFIPVYCHSNDFWRLEKNFIPHNKNLLAYYNNNNNKNGRHGRK